MVSLERRIGLACPVVPLHSGLTQNNKATFLKQKRLSSHSLHFCSVTAFCFLRRSLGLPNPVEETTLRSNHNSEAHHRAIEFL